MWGRNRKLVGIQDVSRSGRYKEGTLSGFNCCPEELIKYLCKRL